MEKYSLADKERTSEKRDKTMEIMETRHRNAIAALEIEKILSEEKLESGEYPTTIAPENTHLKLEALEKLKSVLETLARAKRMRGILTYHLIDVPLLRFPERIRTIASFYGKKLKPFFRAIG